MSYITKTFTFEGKRYYVRGKTEREALLKLANKRRDLEEGKVAVSGNMTVSAWAYKAVEAYKTNQKDITKVKFIRRMKKCVLDETKYGILCTGKYNGKDYIFRTTRNGMDYMKINWQNGYTEK